MTGRRKAWKTKGRFPTLPTAPWKSRPGREIPTFPQLGRAADGKVENRKQVSHFPMRGPRRRTRLTSPAQQPTKGDITRTHLATLALSSFQAHRPLETKAAFRLILCWKQNQISGSFLDWKMLQAPSAKSGGWPLRSCSQSAEEGIDALVDQPLTHRSGFWVCDLLAVDYHQAALSVRRTEAAADHLQRPPDRRVRSERAQEGGHSIRPAGMVFQTVMNVARILRLTSATQSKALQDQEHG